MAACGGSHTLAVSGGVLWSWGRGEDGRLGVADSNNRLVPTAVDPHHFGGDRVVAAAGGQVHSAAVTARGALYTWGRGRTNYKAPNGLGHGGDTPSCLTPARIPPQALGSSRMGRCRRNSLPQDSSLAFAMGTHPRLGAAWIMRLPAELVQRIIAACGSWSWPEGQAGRLEGIVRLAGGAWASG